MDGSKQIADTIDYESRGRQVYREGRSFFVRGGGPRGNKDPGDSRILAW